MNNILLRDGVEVDVADQGMANALRRMLMNEVPSYAPSHIIVRENTTCQTDEYIAHRVAMIPFRLCGKEDGVLKLDVKDKTAFSSDLKGEDFRVACRTIPIMKMTHGQSLCIDVHFTKGTGSEHVKHSHVSRVRYKEHCKCVRVGFKTITDEPPIDFLRRGIVQMEKKLCSLLCVAEADPDTWVVAS